MIETAVTFEDGSWTEMVQLPSVVGVRWAVKLFSAPATNGGVSKSS